MTESGFSATVRCLGGSKTTKRLTSTVPSKLRAVAQRNNVPRTCKKKIKIVVKPFD